jgi:Uma2 family endonuclease
MNADMEAIALPNIETPVAIPTEPVWRLSVAQYHAMAQAGILQEDDQLELLEGWLVAKMTKNPPHRISTRLLRQTLEQLIPQGWYVDSQEPITLEDSEPEPDVAVIRGNTTDYRDRHPDAASVALVIEVADATLERDRGIKQRIYARAGIPIYWILNLRDRQLEVYTQPATEPQTSDAAPAYLQCTIFTEAQSVTVSIMERELGSIRVQDLL